MSAGYCPLALKIRTGRESVNLDGFTVTVQWWLNLISINLDWLTVNVQYWLNLLLKLAYCTLYNSGINSLFSTSYLQLFIFHVIN